MKTIYDFKDRVILFGWIAGLLIIISILWIFTRPVQTYYLMRSVNNVFINNGDSRRLYEFLPQKSGKAGLLGYWYSMRNSSDMMCVFTVFRDGILIPLGAIVSVHGNVQEIIPLSAHAVQIFENMPQSILQLYISRIETSALINMEGSAR